MEGICFELRVLESGLLTPEEASEIFKIIQFKLKLLERLVPELIQKNPGTFQRVSDPEPIQESELQFDRPQFSEEYQAELASRFKKVSRKFHPDRGGETEDYQILTELKDKGYLGSLNRIEKGLTTPHQEGQILRFIQTYRKSDVGEALMTSEEQQLMKRQLEILMKLGRDPKKI